ncbi:ATP-binding cassette domain-containing protein [Nocardioides zeae]|uniref:ATP-binding cassette domain-containing protein n=1 Tax=Nocardioides imazamoxiresistens TaxID=3231893 RepID=A0ABU3PXP8_9ACTN|nr:ATP-binding cassette domain-containing protein [Nocardioides zeae]MDT9594008.1 ATP-binding cassette domain-containing protein [Nocardioides zeae]
MTTAAVLSTTSDATTSEAGAPPVLELEAVTLRRNGKELLGGVDLRVRQGEHWAVLGSNGAGKSTILSLCGAQNHPTSGTVRILGHQLGRIDVQTLRRMIGHVNPRHTAGASLTVEQVVLTGLTGSADLPRRWEPTPDEASRVHELLARVGMATRAGERWPTLSQGERGRTLIARALVGRPGLLLLDEPTTGLDLAAREQFLAAVDDVVAEDPTASTVLVTHHLEELPRTTSHAALVRGGVLVAAGPVDEVLTSELVSAAFDHPIQVGRLNGRWHATSA